MSYDHTEFLLLPATAVASGLIFWLTFSPAVRLTTITSPLRVYTSMYAPPTSQNPTYCLSVTFPKWSSIAILSPTSRLSPNDNQPGTTNYQCVTSRVTSLFIPSSCKVMFKILQTLFSTISLPSCSQIIELKEF